MKEFRLRRLFGADGRTVIIAFDHASFMGDLPGLENPGALLDELCSSGVDAVLTTMGVARAYCGRFGRLGLILRADGGSSVRSPTTGAIQLLFSVEDAVRLGADAVICMGMIGFPEEPSSLRNLATLCAQSAEWSLPVMAEMLVNGQDGKDATPEDVGFAMRIGVELGADLIKAPFSSPIERYRSALASCYRPAVVLGGAKVDEEARLLETVQMALEAGAAGVAIGRNVWQHPDPAGMCRALAALVHGGASVGSALTEIRK
jgi:DhnA family fructose-bisphosphate aldolase class Ia